MINQWTYHASTRTSRHTDDDDQVNTERQQVNPVFRVGSSFLVVKFMTLTCVVYFLLRLAKFVRVAFLCSFFSNFFFFLLDDKKSRRSTNYLRSLIVCAQNFIDE